MSCCHVMKPMMS